MIELNKKEIKKFVKFAKRSYPKECCGFPIGVRLSKKILIEKIYIPQNQEKNATPDKIDIPDDWWDEALEEAQENELELLGLIHSHPDYRDVSMSEADSKLLEWTKLMYPEIKNPIMGIVGVWEAKKRMMSRVGIWPMFNQFDIDLI